MLTIQVASLPLEEVIEDIAIAFEASEEKVNGENIIRLPKAIGKGSIRGLNFDGGLGIIQYDCNFSQDTEIQFIVNEVHPLKFLYVIKGKLHHRFANENTSHTVESFQNAIVASSNKNGHILTFKKDIETCIFSLEINRKIFQQKVGFNKEGMNAKLKNLFEDTTAEKPFYYEGDYSLEMADIFKSIRTFEGGYFLHMLFMESIAYQTLLQQISQYLDDQRIKKDRTVLRRNEIDTIITAAEYIDNHIATYQSIPELSKVVGLNATKLQEGFKHLYNKTVNEYVYDARLKLSKSLLLNTDDNISEIVYKVGLSSKSYFSKIFKKEYGVQPSTFRKNK